MIPARLAQLEREYAGAPFKHLFWKDFPKTIPLDRFRDSPHYLGQEINKVAAYRAAYDHVRGSDPLGLLGKLSEDGDFGCCTLSFDGVTVSRDLLDSILEITFLRTTLGEALEKMAILDVGAGYGRLAHRVATLYPDTITACVDGVARSTYCCERYLAHRGVKNAGAVSWKDLESIGQIDLACNIHSFSECTISTVEFWLDFMCRKGARYFFLVPHPNELPPDVVVSNDGNDFYPTILRHGFRLVKREPKFPQWYGGQESPLEIRPTISYYLFERSRQGQALAVQDPTRHSK